MTPERVYAQGTRDRESRSTRVGEFGAREWDCLRSLVDTAGGGYPGRVERCLVHGVSASTDERTCQPSATSLRISRPAQRLYNAEKPNALQRLFGARRPLGLMLFRLGAVRVL